MSLAGFSAAPAAGLCAVPGRVSLTRQMNRKQRRVFIVGILVAVVETTVLGPIPQDPGFDRAFNL